MSNSSDPLAATNLWPNEPTPDKGAAGSAFEAAAKSVTPPTIPETLGRYRIEGLLGGGGFGWVYRAFDEQLGRAVAIKVPDERLLKRAISTDVYRNEARLVAQLDHPHILPVYDVGSAPEVSCFVVSRLISGSDLAHLLREERVSYLESADIIAKLARAVHHAHKQGIIHRDIKPGNILLDQKRTPYLADFGLALDEATFGKGPEFAGTPAYMSPEQAGGEGHRVDGRADVFSLGVVFYELLTGRRPFTARKQSELLEQIIHHDPRPPRQIDDRIPREFERICLKAMAKRILDRYTTAKDMAEDLEVAIAECDALAGMHATIALSLDAPPQAASHVTPHGNVSTPPANRTPTAHNSPLTHTSRDVAKRDSAKPGSASVIPKGLRSFDEKDADYFLELLPGARDREGLPVPVRFWKTHIEARDAEHAFPVGLLYGPSGCGKSSLVKAGLIPRLNDDCVAIYLEATPESTEVRLLQALRRACPGLSDGDLVSSFARLRRGEGNPGGRKVVIFIDQFEQWLHAHRAEEASVLAAALRQCDGPTLQCILMVRDDFWMSVTRFMRELEVRLVEGWNSAAVDLFGPRHARRVLAAFGRAYGCVPPDCDEEGTSPEAEFIRQAVNGLTENGTIIPVRLALLADMMKMRQWTPSSLQATGGAAGIGAAFLDETFVATTAPPEHRFHQQAARNVLKSLLYVPGQATSIKGGMRSTEELLRASGYQRRPDDFQHLIQILDSQLRLITPTEPGQADLSSTSLSQAPVADRSAQYYQLTHDYLVPTLRDWLTRKQRETIRGRAELRLEEHSELWHARPVSSQLPEWWDVIHILLFTRRPQWTPEQRRMMRAATRKQSVHVAILVAILALVGWGALEGNGRIRAGTLAERVVRSETRLLPQILTELRPYQRWANPLLRAERSHAKTNSSRWVNTTLALLPSSPDLAKPLADYAVSAPKDQFVVIRDALIPHRNLVSDKLWMLLESPTEDSARRIAAGLLLARMWPAKENGSQKVDAARWRTSSVFLVSQLLDTAVNDTQQFEWISDGFDSVGQEFVPALTAIYQDGKRDPLQRSIAMNLVESYADDEVVPLVDVLLTSADPSRFTRIFGKLQPHREAVLKQLHEQFKDGSQSAQARWDDAAIDPTWTEVDENTKQQVEAAHGMLTERFAIGQTVPFEKYPEIEASLRTSGYRPPPCAHFQPGRSYWWPAYGLVIQHLGEVH